jgi:hypothetical protein
MIRPIIYHVAGSTGLLSILPRFVRKKRLSVFASNGRRCGDKSSKAVCGELRLASMPQLALGMRCDV